MSGILVMEDDKAVRTLVVEWLELDGYEVWQEGDDGSEGRDFALVVVDVPDLLTRGAELIGRVRCVHPRARLIVLSTQLRQSLTGESEVARRLSVSYLVAKPFMRVELLQAVVRSIGRHS